MWHEILLVGFIPQFPSFLPKPLKFCVVHWFCGESFPCPRMWSLIVSMFHNMPISTWIGLGHHTNGRKSSEKMKHCRRVKYVQLGFPLQGCYLWATGTHGWQLLLNNWDLQGRICRSDSWPRKLLFCWWLSPFFLHLSASGCFSSIFFPISWYTRQSRCVNLMLGELLNNLE